MESVLIAAVVVEFETTVAILSWRIGGEVGVVVVEDVCPWAAQGVRPSERDVVVDVVVDVVGLNSRSCRTQVGVGGVGGVSA